MSSRERAVSEFVPNGRGTVEFVGGEDEEDRRRRVSGEQELTKLRLLAIEVDPLRYVLSEWSGEAGLSSNMSAQMERLAQDPNMLEDVTRKRHRARPVTRFGRVDAAAYREHWEDKLQLMHVPSAKPAADVEALATQEKWCDKATADERFGRPDPRGDVKVSECDKIVRAWRALCLMAAARLESLVILHALYGDLPPGLPMRGLWSKSVDDEYRRVSRYAAHSGGTAAALEAMTRIDNKRHEGESESSFRMRRVGAKNARTALLRKVGAECEKLIIAASLDYRSAWREA